MTQPDTSLLERFDECLARHAPDGRLVLAFSGGRDSTVLLHLLARHRTHRDCLVLHVDHGLHEASARWVEHCREQAVAWGIPFHLERLGLRVPPGESLEAVARRERHAVFERLLEAGDTLLMAHHADDQLETLLYRLMRGAGSRGLSGMPFRRPLGAGQLLRPLLSEPGETIRAYAEAHRLTWVEDPSNRDLRFDRNWLRHRVMDALRKRWPGAVAQAARAAANLADDAAVLTELAREDMTRLGDRRMLERAGLTALSEPRRRNLLRHWLEQAVGYPPSRSVLDRVQQEVLAAAPDARPQLVIGDRLLRREGDRLHLQAAGEPSEPVDPGPFRWPAPHEPLSLPGNGRLLAEPVAGEDPAVRLPRVTTVRYRRDGDRFHDGRHHRRLTEWMRLAEIPPSVRDRIPLLLDGDRLFAVGGTVVDPRYIATETGQVADEGYVIRWLEEDG